MTNPLSDKTILSIDYGTKRVGLAKSDSMGIIATALGTLEVRSMKDALNRVTDIIGEVSPSVIVVGYPLLQSGDKSDFCREIDLFVEKLGARFGGPIYMVDEAYSSEEAAGVIRAHKKRPGQDKKRVDRLAAVIILQRYLDEHDTRDLTP